VLPGRDAIKAELTRLITATSPQFYGLQARDTRLFALYFDPKFQQPMLVALDATADPDSSRTVLDPNKLDASGHTAIDWYSASPDGTRVAVSLSLNGSEDGALHVYDVASAREIDAPIPRVQYPTAGGSVAWTADSKAFWYTRYPGDDAPVRRGAHAAEGEIAQAVEYDPLPVAFDPLEHVGMVPQHDICACIDGCVGNGYLVAVRHGRSFLPPVKGDDHIVALSLGTGDVALDVCRVAGCGAGMVGSGEEFHRESQ